MSQVVTTWASHFSGTIPGTEEVSPSDGLSFGDSASGTTGDQTIDVAVTRLESGTGSGLCSTGIPLPPGTLEPGNTDKVKVVVNSVEQQIYVEDLSGTHPDGTVRSILVQFNISVDYGSPLTGQVDVGSGVSRSTEDISKTSVTWDTPVIVCTPTSADYLISCELILPTIPVADVPGSPDYLEDYEDNFSTYGDIHWNAEYPAQNVDNAIICNYYDRVAIWYTWWIRTGAFDYWRRGTLQAEEYLSYFNSNYAPRNQSLEGVELHYLLVGNPDSKTAIVDQAKNNYDTWDDDLDMTSENIWMEGRIQSRTFMSYLLSWRLGDNTYSWSTYLESALTKILATQDAVTGAYDNWLNTDHTPDKHVPYMTGLINAAFIRYYTWYDGDSRIPTAIQKAIDHEWDNLWVSGDHGFLYQTGASSGQPDLNMLCVIGPAWYYAYSSTSTYLTRANTIFEAGVDYAYQGGANTGIKQWNQQYKHGHHHLYWRLGSL